MKKKPAASKPSRSSSAKSARKAPAKSARGPARPAPAAAAPVAAAPSKANCWFLEDEQVAIGIDKATGAIRSAVIKAKGIDLCQLRRSNMEPKAGYVRIYDELEGVWHHDLSGRVKVTSATKRGGRLTLVKQYAGAAFTVTETFRLDHGSLMWEVQAAKKNSKLADRSLRVGFNMPLEPGWQVWAPCAQGEFTFDGMDDFSFNHVQVTFVSPREIILPMVSHYHKEQEVGFSMLDPVCDKVPAARFQYSNAEKLFAWGYNRKPTAKLPTVEALNYYIGLVGDAPMKTRVQVLFHGGCWRCGLGEVYRRYREYFDPDSEAIFDYEGVFNCGGVYIGEDPKPYLDLGLKTLEVHGHFSTYCDYYNEGKDKWLKIGMVETTRRRLHGPGQPEADGHEVWKFLNSATPEQIADVYFGPDWRAKGIDIDKEMYHTRDNIKQMLTNMEEAGIKLFWYFNYTDGFRPVVEERWPDAICLDQDGKPIPSGWHMCHNMNADLSTSFGQFCDRSIEQILAEYPQLHGFFLDCFRHYEVDYAHQDGITVVDNRPAYSVNFSYDDITRRMKEHIAAAGKPRAIFANKPQTIRCMRHVDGVLLEGGGDQAEEKYFWACIAKPDFFMWTSNEAGVDENLRRAVLHGCFPKLTKTKDDSDHAAMVDLYARYLPLYEPFRRRVLCFEPDPIRVPRGARGKLYTVGSDYVAGICTPAVDSEDQVKHARTPYAMFRVKRGWDVGKVGVMYPGDKQWRLVDFKFNGTMIAVPMPEYKNCAVVKLFVTGDSGKPIGTEKFRGPIDFCGDPESSFQDISKR